MNTDMLGVRELNRALLARQLLLARSDLAPLQAVEHLVGMQAQAPQAPYVGLWSRLADFAPEQASQLLTDRELVRIGLMRGTVHLVTAEDCLLLRAWLQPLVYERYLPANPSYLKAVAGIEDELVETVEALLTEAPRTNAELRTMFAERWPDRDAAALTWGVRFAFPCVQVPPRGVWLASGQATVTTAQAWLGRPLVADPSPSAVVLRYLAAYGPASVQDMQTWCGVTRLREVFEELRPQLRVFRGETGELFDLPDAPRPVADTPAPVRFLPEYDNLLRSHADRTHVMSADARARLATKNDSPRPTFLVDGVVAGGWRLERRRTTATLTIEPFVTLSAAARDELTAEAVRLLGFAAPDRTYDIRFAATD